MRQDGSGTTGTVSAAGGTGDTLTFDDAPVASPAIDDAPAKGTKGGRDERPATGDRRPTSPLTASGSAVEAAGLGATGGAQGDTPVSSAPPRLTPIDLVLTSASTSAPAGRAASVAPPVVGPTLVASVAASAPGPLAPAVAVPPSPAAVAVGLAATLPLLAPSLPIGPASMPPVPMLPEGDGGLLLIGLLGLGAIAFRGRRFDRDPKLEGSPLDTGGDLLEFR